MKKRIALIALLLISYQSKAEDSTVELCMGFLKANYSHIEEVTHKPFNDDMALRYLVDELLKNGNIQNKYQEEKLRRLANEGEGIFEQQLKAMKACKKYSDENSIKSCQEDAQKSYVDIKRTLCSNALKNFKGKY